MNESLQERQEYLFLTVDNMLHQREIWSNDTVILGLPSGGALWMAANQMVEAFKEGTIPASCRNLSTAVEEFSRHWSEHVTRSEVSREDDLVPGNNVWGAVDSIKAARDGAVPKPPKEIEPVALLVKQKVSEVQIAKIYEWENEYGQPDLVKVRDAIANPGKWDGKAHAEVIQGREQDRQAQQKQQLEELRERIGKKKNAKPQPGPESIETLIVQGLNVAQISSVKVMPVEDVLKYCRDHGIELTGNAPSASGRPAAGQADNNENEDNLDQPGWDDQEPDESSLPNQGEDDDLSGRYDDSEFNPPEGSPLPIEQQVLNAADNNQDARPGEIGTLLGVSAQKVAAILRRREEVEETVS